MKHQQCKFPCNQAVRLGLLWKLKYITFSYTASVNYSFFTWELHHHCVCGYKQLCNKFIPCYHSLTYFSIDSVTTHAGRQHIPLSMQPVIFNFVKFWNTCKKPDFTQNTPYYMHKLRCKQYYEKARLKMSNSLTEFDTSTSLTNQSVECLIFYGSSESQRVRTTK